MLTQKKNVTTLKPKKGITKKSLHFNLKTEESHQDSCWLYGGLCLRKTENK